MVEREKVIRLLSEIADYFRECRSNASFASKAENHFWELQNAASDAVELLKEQEAVKPKIDAFGHPYCPKCKILVYETWEFCPHCGRELIWND